MAKTSHHDESERVAFLAAILLPLLLWRTYTFWGYLLYIVAICLEYKFHLPFGEVASIVLWFFVVYTERRAAIAACTSLCLHHVFFKWRRRVYAFERKEA